MALSLDGTTGITSDGGTPVIENLDTTATGINVTGVLTATSFSGDGSALTGLGGGFAAGTVMLFGQTAAPTGWTKDTTNYNNSGLRIVTGTVTTGGSVDFSTAFASQTPAGTVSVAGSAGATTLSTAQIPSHTHTQRGTNQGGAGAAVQVKSSNSSTTSLVYSLRSTLAAGGGGSHSHALTISSASFSGTAINLAVKYVDIIRATKD